MIQYVPMELLTIIVILGFIILLAVQGWVLHRLNDERSESGKVEHELLKEKLNEMNTRLEKSSDKMNETVKEQFKDSRDILKDMTEQLTLVKEKTKGLGNLEKILLNQKTRGSLGEAGLELILENMLPPGSFEMQYAFDNGEAVDAVIKTDDQLVPIDAKFSLTTYQRILNEDDTDKQTELKRQFVNDLKQRIKETAKYIRPEEGTLKFALMYIPAEGVFYDLLAAQHGKTGANPQNLIEFAHSKNVVIVSPATLSAFLHTILQGLRAFQIEKDAERIHEGVEALKKHLRAY